MSNGIHHHNLRSTICLYKSRWDFTPIFGSTLIDWNNIPLYIKDNAYHSYDTFVIATVNGLGPEWDGEREWYCNAGTPYGVISAYICIPNTVITNTKLNTTSLIINEDQRWKEIGHEISNHGK